MVNTKKYGFTLGETLAAMLIVGIIAVLSLPTLMRNIQEKNRMTLLKGTVVSVGNVIQSEFTRQRTDEITSTDIYKNPKTFMQKFEGAKSGKPFATSYKRYSDAKVAQNVLIPSDDNSNQAVLLLKNGVGIGVVNDPENKKTSIIVDVTGEDKPNMVGVDYFILKVEWYDQQEQRELVKDPEDPDTKYNYTRYKKAGDISGYENGGVEGSESGSGLRTSCLEGNGAACFRMVELSSYDPKYLH